MENSPISSTSLVAVPSHLNHQALRKCQDDIAAQMETMRRALDDAQDKMLATLKILESPSLDALQPPQSDHEIAAVKESPRFAEIIVADKEETFGSVGSHVADMENIAGLATVNRSITEKPAEAVANNVADISHDTGEFGSIYRHELIMLDDWLIYLNDAFLDKDKFKMPVDFRDKYLTRIVDKIMQVRINITDFLDVNTDKEVNPFTKEYQRFPDEIDGNEKQLPIHRDKLIVYRQAPATPSPPPACQYIPPPACQYVPPACQYAPPDYQYVPPMQNDCCYYCGVAGHFKNQCHHRQMDLSRVVVRDHAQFAQGDIWTVRIGKKTRQINHQAFQAGSKKSRGKKSQRNYVNVITVPGRVDSVESNETAAQNAVSVQPQVNSDVMVISVPCQIPIDTFGGKRHESLRVFLMKFNDRMDLLDAVPTDAKKKVLLLNSLTDAAREEARLALEENPDATTDDIIVWLKKEFESQVSIEKKMELLRECRQEDEEPVVQFIDRHRQLMMDATADNNKEEIARIAKESFTRGLLPQTMFDIRSSQPMPVKLKDIQHKAEFLEDIRKTCEKLQRERQEKSRQCLAEDTSVPNEPKHRDARFAGYADQQHSSDHFDLYSYNQGHANHVDKKTRKQIECFYCGMQGHFRSKCNLRAHDRRNGNFWKSGKPTTPTWEDQVRATQLVYQPFINVIDNQEDAWNDGQVNDSDIFKSYDAAELVTPQIRMQVNGKWIKALIDTGAAITVTTEKILPHLGVTSVESSHLKDAAGFGGHALMFVGAVQLVYAFGGHMMTHPTHVISKESILAASADYDIIIGTDLLRRLPTFHIDFEKKQFKIGAIIFKFGIINGYKRMEKESQKINVTGSRGSTTN